MLRLETPRGVAPTPPPPTPAKVAKHGLRARVKMPVFCDTECAALLKTTWKESTYMRCWLVAEKNKSEFYIMDIGHS